MMAFLDKGYLAIPRKKVLQSFTRGGQPEDKLGGRAIKPAGQDASSFLALAQCLIPLVTVASFDLLLCLAPDVGTQ